MKPLITFSCADCGRRATKPSPSFLCEPCVTERKRLRMKDWRLRNPDYATNPRAREYKRAWAAEKRKTLPPIVCNTCGEATMPRAIGRHLDVACRECSRLNANYATLLRRARTAKPRPMHSCRTCGVAVPRARGRTSEKARCRACIRETAREYDRQRRAA